MPRYSPVCVWRKLRQRTDAASGVAITSSIATSRSGKPECRPRANSFRPSGPGGSDRPGTVTTQSSAQISSAASRSRSLITASKTRRTVASFAATAAATDASVSTALCDISMDLHILLRRDRGPHEPDGVPPQHVAGGALEDESSAEDPGLLRDAAHVALPSPLVKTKRGADVPVSLSAQALRHDEAVLDRLARALSEVRRHRMSGVAEECDAPVHPGPREIVCRDDEPGDRVLRLGVDEARG